MLFRRIAAGVTAATITVALAACAPAAAEETLTLRLWDESAAKAYEQSVAAFEAETGIAVEVVVEPWDSYFTTLRTSVATDEGPDVFWLNGANFGDYATSGNLVNIDETFGTDAKNAWNPEVVSQYSLDGTLWGVPQTIDGGIAYYVNDDLLAEAGVTAQELSDAKWSLNPDEDTFLPLLQKLTIDANGNNAAAADFDPASVETYAFNASTELQNIQLNFIASNGGTFQDAEGNMTFTNPKTVEAYQYLVDLINEYHVAPPAEATNPNGDYTRDQFLQGNLAVFSSGAYSLSPIHSAAPTFEWSITEMAAGPEGKGTVAPGLIMAGNANSSQPENVQALLEWLGSAEGVDFLGSSGFNMPAVADAEGSFEAFWEQEGVDVSAFYTVLDDAVINAPVSSQKNFGAQMEAYLPALNSVFLGSVPVLEGLEEAQAAADAVS